MILPDSINSSQSETQDQSENKTNYLVRFVSHISKEEIHGFNILKKWLEEQGLTIETFEFKSFDRKELRKPINPKNPEGPTEKIVVEEKIDLNTSLKQIRQMTTRIGTDPHNILLVQIEKTRGTFFSLNLIFEQFFKTGKPVVVSKMDKLLRDQLFAKPDLSFEKIPVEIKENSILKENLLKRVSRPRMMLALVRELGGISFSNPKIDKKIKLCKAGQPVKWEEAEAINFLLIADLYNRYSAMLNNFEKDILDRKEAVQAMASMFQILMQDVSIKQLQKELGSYLTNLKTSIDTHSQLFQQIYASLPKPGKNKEITNEGKTKIDSLFNKLKNIFILNRSQFDPARWKKCIYFDFTLDQPEFSIEVNKNNLEKLATNIKKAIKGYHQATTQGLAEIYTVHNSYNFIQRRKIYLGQLEVSCLTRRIIEKVHLQNFNLGQAAGNDENCLKLFTDEGRKTEVRPELELFNNVHCVSRVYGIFIIKQLDRMSQRFLRPGLKDLIRRYQDNFFDIMYESVVTNSNIPLTREQFAHWLEIKKLVGTVKKRGWIPGKAKEIEKFKINKSLLKENGDSLFPNTFCQEDFERKYQKSHEKFIRFINILKEDIDENDEFNIAKVLYSILKKGIYNIKSSQFRKQIAGTFLYKGLSRLVEETTFNLKAEIYKESNKGKLIIKLPLSYEPLLWLGNLFILDCEGEKITIHLMAVAVDSPGGLNGISRKFSEEWEKVLKRPSFTREKLLNCQEYLIEFDKLEIFLCTGLMFIDRLLQKSIVPAIMREKLKPNQIKYKFKDSQKLIVGNNNNIKLNNVLAYDSYGDDFKVEDIDSISFGNLTEFFNSLEFSRKGLERIRKNLIKIILLFDKFSEETKNTDEWKQFDKLLKTFAKIIALPIIKLEKKYIEKLQEVAEQLKIVIDQAEDPETVIYRFIQAWKSKNNDDSALRFFYPFLKRKKEINNNLIQKIILTQQQIRRIKKVKVIVCFPEGMKKYQLRHLGELHKKVRDLALKIDIFIETSYLSREQVELLCRIYYPGCFFRVDRINPEKNIAPTD